MPWTTPRDWTTGELVTETMMDQQVSGNFNAAFPLGVDAWTAYTPALTATTTNPTLGTGSTAAGRYQRVGRSIWGQLNVKFGTSGTAAGSGTYRLSLPVTARSNTFAEVCGSGYILDASASDLRFCLLRIVGTTIAEIYFTAVTNFFVTHAVPWAWTINDEFNFSFLYEAAS